MKSLFNSLLILLILAGFSFAQDNLPTLMNKGKVGGNISSDAVLYDQTVGTNTNAYTSQDFETAFDAYDGWIADDFTATDNWTIEQVVVNGSYSVAGPADGFNVFFYTDAAGIPGTEVYSELSAPYVYDGVSLFTITLVTPAVLSAGNYWVSVQCRMDFSPNGQWYFAQVNGTYGNVAQFKNPGDGFASGCTNWGSIQTCVAAVGTDQSFALLGTTGGGPTGGVLLISENTTGADSVEAWLNALGETYTRMTNTVALGLPTSDWLMYDCAFYIGTASSGSQIDSCTAYMNGGGNLLVWDNDQGYFYPTTPFLLDYLMSIYQTDGGSNGIITGMELMSGITLDISADPYPDDFLPNTGSYGTGVPIFLAPTTTTYAGMRGDGGSFRSELLAWDPQNGGSYASNLEVLSRTLLWLVDGLIPVELTSFSASVNNGNVELNWKTATELNNRGFDIERNSGTGFEKVGYVPGFGTTTEPRSYSFKDEGLSSGIYEYRLKQIDFDGTFAYSQVIETEVVLPKVYSMEQNYPNPFNPSTKINFSLAVDSKVSLKIFDVLGQEVSTLVNENLSAGSYNYDFNATNINSGVYFYKIEAVGVNGAKFVDIKKMMLLK